MCTCLTACIHFITALCFVHTLIIKSTFVTRFWWLNNKGVKNTAIYRYLCNSENFSSKLVPNINGKEMLIASPFNFCCSGFFFKQLFRFIKLGSLFLGTISHRKDKRFVSCFRCLSFALLLTPVVGFVPLAYLQRAYIYVIKHGW